MQKRNTNRVNVYLDDEYAFGLSRIVAAWLYIGQELSDEKITELKTDDSYEVAYQQAINFLSYRARSQTEVINHLKKHDIDDEIIERVMQRLQSSELVNDERFVRNWIENRNEFRPRGQRALAFELRQKGIPEDVIRTNLNELDEEQLAYTAAQKQAKKYIALQWPDFRKKMYSFLARRGFSYEVSVPVVARVWQEYLNENGVEPYSTDQEVNL